MAGRCTAGFLEIMGVTDTIARDKADYVEVAARLAEDAKFREGVENQMYDGLEIILVPVTPALPTSIHHRSRRLSAPCCGAVQRCAAGCFMLIGAQPGGSVEFQADQRAPAVRPADRGRGVGAVL